MAVLRITQPNGLNTMEIVSTARELRRRALEFYNSGMRDAVYTIDGELLELRESVEATSNQAIATEALIVGLFNEDIKQVLGEGADQGNDPNELTATTGDAPVRADRARGPQRAEDQRAEDRVDARVGDARVDSENSETLPGESLDVRAAEKEQALILRNARETLAIQNAQLTAMMRTTAAFQDQITSINTRMAEERSAMFSLRKAEDNERRRVEIEAINLEQRRDDLQYKRDTRELERSIKLRRLEAPSPFELFSSVLAMFLQANMRPDFGPSTNQSTKKK